VTDTVDARPVASLTFVRPPVGDAEEALLLLTRAAVEQGYALSTLPDAVVDRERQHPTGLPTPLPCAIPHADASHVQRPGIGLLLADQPLAFGEMGSRDRTVAARLVVLLLVDDPASQVGLLGGLVRTLQRADLEEFLTADLAGPDDLAARLTAALDDQAGTSP